MQTDTCLKFWVSGIHNPPTKTNATKHNSKANNNKDFHNSSQNTTIDQ